MYVIIVSQGVAMTNKTVMEEGYCTIIDIFEYPVTYDNISSIEKGIIIQPDDSKEGTITDAHERDFSQFSVGQRVVSGSYTWKRPATIQDKNIYSFKGEKCPNEIDEYEHSAYDELLYDQKKATSKKKYIFNNKLKYF